MTDFVVDKRFIFETLFYLLIFIIKINSIYLQIKIENAKPRTSIHKLINKVKHFICKC